MIEKNEIMMNGVMETFNANDIRYIVVPKDEYAEKNDILRVWDISTSLTGNIGFRLADDVANIIEHRYISINKIISSFKMYPKDKGFNFLYIPHKSAFDEKDNLAELNIKVSISHSLSINVSTTSDISVEYLYLFLEAQTQFVPNEDKYINYLDAINTFCGDEKLIPITLPSIGYIADYVDMSVPEEYIITPGPKIINGNWAIGYSKNSDRYEYASIGFDDYIIALSRKNDEIIKFKSGNTILHKDINRILHNFRRLIGELDEDKCILFYSKNRFLYKFIHEIESVKYVKTNSFGFLVFEKNTNTNDNTDTEVNEDESRY